MMSAFVDEAIRLAKAVDSSHGVYDRMVLLTQLREYLEAREALLVDMAEALAAAYAEHSDDYELRWLEEARAALQAYDEANKS